MKAIAQVKARDANEAACSGKEDTAATWRADEMRRRLQYGINIYGPAEVSQFSDKLSRPNNGRFSNEVFNFIRLLHLDELAL